MSETIHGVFKTNSNGDIDLWVAFETRKETSSWISSSRFPDKYHTKEIPSTKENMEYLYHNKAIRPRGVL